MRGKLGAGLSGARVGRAGREREGETGQGRPGCAWPWARSGASLVRAASGARGRARERASAEGGGRAGPGGVRGGGKRDPRRRAPVEGAAGWRRGGAGGEGAGQARAAEKEGRREKREGGKEKKEKEEKKEKRKKMGKRKRKRKGGKRNKEREGASASALIAAAVGHAWCRPRATRRPRANRGGTAEYLGVGSMGNREIRRHREDSGRLGLEFQGGISSSTTKQNFSA